MQLNGLTINDYKYSECSSDLRAFIPRTSTRPTGMGLPRSSWVRLNRLRADVGCFQSFMHKWGLAPTLNCKCGAAEQTAEHIILTCPVQRAPTRIRGLTVLDVNTSVPFNHKKSANLRNYVRQICSSNSTVRKKSPAVFGNFFTLLKFLQFC